MKLEKIYENYQEITDSSLLLSSFANDYKKASYKETKEENEILIKVTLKNYNKYIKYKELYLDKDTGIPLKMVIRDSSNNPKIIIEYTNIEIL
ncbi:MAG: hypothetical protein IJ629_03175 [Clostridia bacterium]|nr:hypothetical protein [Clostridia bacterium]